MPLLSLNNVTKQFVLPSSLLGRLLGGQKDRVVHAINGVSLDLNDNETLGLVGESGSGKSTLGRVAIRLLRPTAGNVIFQDRDISALEGQRIRDIRRQMQVIFQNPYSSLNPRKTIRQIVGVALKASGISNLGDQDQEIRQLLKRVSLPERFIDAYPHQLSGGQRQRISIIRALAVHPRLIVADEPVSALDVSVQAQIIRLLADLKKEFSLTYLFISHDLRVVYHISDRVAVMYLGRIVEVGETEALYKNPQHPYTRALLAAIPQLDRINVTGRFVLKGTVPTPLAPPDGCYFHTRCPEKLDHRCETQRPGWTQITPTHQVACFRCGDAVSGGA
ncbi:MAG: ABC transporter ATP-binding protein [Pseudomonadota bacterium]